MPDRLSLSSTCLLFSFFKLNMLSWYETWLEKRLEKQTKSKERRWKALKTSSIMKLGTVWNFKRNTFVCFWSRTESKPLQSSADLHLGWDVLSVKDVAYSSHHFHIIIPFSEHSSLYFFCKGDTLERERWKWWRVERMEICQAVKKKKKEGSRWVFDSVCGAGRRQPWWIFDWLMRRGRVATKGTPFWPCSPRLSSSFSLSLDGTRPPTGDVSDQCSHYLCCAHSGRRRGQMRERCAMTRSERM